MTWNPDRWQWKDKDFNDAGRRTAKGELVGDQWSTGGRTKDIDQGDRVFLLRQGVEPRGIVASGWFNSTVWQGPHWDDTPGRLANYADVLWDAVVGDEVLPLTALESDIPSMGWEPRAGGVAVPDAAAQDLEDIWSVHLNELGRSPGTAPSAQTAWLLLSVGEDRQHGGNEGYNDDPAVTYRWDSTVAHHADIAPGDTIVLWDKKTSIGASVIESIETGSKSKTLNKCPHCGKAGIKARKDKAPKYKCYKCGGVFDKPKTQRKNVITYETRHDIAWVDLAGVLSGPQLRNLCKDPKSQQSMRPLQWEALRNAVKAAGQGPVLDALTSSSARITGGHKERTVRVRVGQPQFRKTLIAKYGPVCAFTGTGPLTTLEAGHLYSYAKSGEHHTDGGLLLRRDVHRLFDLGFLAVDPMTLKIDVHADLHDFPVYKSLDGCALHVALTKRQKDWLEHHWSAHRD